MYTKDNSTNNDIQDDFQRVKDKARETRDALSQTATDVKGKANEIFTQSVKEGRAKAEELLEDGRARAEDLQEDVITYVQSNPLKSIGISLFIGAAIALLLRQ